MKQIKIKGVLRWDVTQMDQEHVLAEEKMTAAQTTQYSSRGPSVVPVVPTRDRVPGGTSSEDFPS